MKKMHIVIPLFFLFLLAAEKAFALERKLVPVPSSDGELVLISWKVENFICKVCFWDKNAKRIFPEKVRFIAGKNVLGLDESGWHVTSQNDSESSEIFLEELSASGFIKRGFSCISEESSGSSIHEGTDLFFPDPSQWGIDADRGILKAFFPDGRIVILETDNKFYLNKSNAMKDRSSPENWVDHALSEPEGTLEKNFLELLSMSFRNEFKWKDGKCVFSPTFEYSSMNPYMVAYLEMLFERQTGLLSGKNNDFIPENHRISTKEERDSILGTAESFTLPGFSELERTSVCIPSWELAESGDFAARIVNGELETAVIDKTGGETKLIFPGKNGKPSVTKKMPDMESEGFFHPRRLLFEKDPSDTENPPNIIRDIFSTKVSEASFRIGRIHEATQTASAENKWRWIPNTGEWLFAGNFDFKMENASGLSVFDDRTEFSLSIKLSDRNRSNCPNSAGSSFDIMARASDGTEFFLGIFELTDSGVYIPKSQEAELFIKDAVLRARNSNGDIIAVDGIMIRPNSASSFNFGDDFFIFFEASEVSTGKAQTFHVKNAGSQFFSVYDKKALWRANLYIDESASGKLDWNSVHPWNAPSSASGMSEEKWWNPAWGENQWNLVCSTSDNFTHRSQLPQGNGRQVVQPCTFTSLRTGDGDYVSGTVAFDLCHDFSNAWDSPFDFVTKLSMQKNCLQNHFISLCGPVIPAEEIVLLSEKNAFSHDLLSDLDKSAMTGIFPVNSMENIECPETTNSSLAFWHWTRAPNDRWEFYWKDGAGAFIPSLGFFLQSVNETKEASDILSRMEFPSARGAGTDSLALVQRATAYSGNRYKWNADFPMPKDRAEGNPDPDSAARKAKNLVHPESSASLQNTVVSWTDVFIATRTENASAYEKTLSDFDLEELRGKFLSVIPGDIVSYETANEESFGEYNSGTHTGMISEIDTDAMENAGSVHEMLASITVIESVCSGNTLGVIKRTMAESCGNKSFQDKTESVTGNWFVDEEGKARSWKIQRLSVSH